MDIAFHLGVHLTDQDHLIRCLLRNRARLAAEGVAIPSPGSYRRHLRQLAHDLRDLPTDGATQETLLDGLIEGDDIRRVVFANDNFLAVHRWIVGDNRFYPVAGMHVARLARLFPMARVGVYFAIRNPATFLPALIADPQSGGAGQVLRDSDPLRLRWSEMIARIATEAPGVAITVWRDEDTALLWPEILRAVSDHDPARDLDGWFAWYWPLVTPKGHEAMRRWFAANPPGDDRHRRRVLSAMLERFAVPDKIEADTALPGWDEATVDALHALYDQDLDLIASMPGVTLLEP